MKSGMIERTIIAHLRSSFQVILYSIISFENRDRYHLLAYDWLQKTPEINELETDKNSLQIWAHNFEKQKT